MSICDSSTLCWKLFSQVIIKLIYYLKITCLLSSSGRYSSKSKGTLAVMNFKYTQTNNGQATCPKNKSRNTNDSCGKTITTIWQKK